MTFLEHLDELRSRLLFIVLALAVFFAVGWMLHAPALDLLMQPVRDNLPEGIKPVFTTLTEPFLLAFKVAFFVGLLLAFPFVVLQIWLFVSPGLYRRERRYAVPFIIFGSTFFFIGAWFGYTVVFPFAARFLIEFSGERFSPMLTISRVFGFEMHMILAMGIVFQLPVLILLLSRLGLITPRFLLRHFKYAILAIFIIAAILTPTPDAITMTLVAGPMVGLYLLGILVSVLFARRPQDEDGNDGDEDGTAGDEDGNAGDGS